MYTKPAEQPGSAWVSYIRVADVRAGTRRIAAAGGQPMVGPMEVPGGDLITIATDPQGAMFAIHALPAAKSRTAGKKGAARKRAGKTGKKAKVTKRTAKAAVKPKSRAQKKSRSGKARRK